jgi:hypothetical protein
MLNTQKMQELDEAVLKEIQGGWGVLIGIIAGGLIFEVVTEGFEKCWQDLKEGYKSTQK